MFRSRNYYVRIRGEMGLFTNPATKGGGERSSYLVPTLQALIGMMDAIYYKPTIKNVVTEVKVIKQIQTELHGTRALLHDYSADLSSVSYLSQVEYLVKFHFVWNENRPDLMQDRVPNKHEAIMERSLKKGGRRDIFIGVKECLGLAEAISQEDYETTPSYYQGETIDFGLMFHSFSYPTEAGQSLKSYFSQTTMIDGKITFKEQSECEVVNQLSSYSFKPSGEIKFVHQEYEDYQTMEKGEK